MAERNKEDDSSDKDKRYDEKEIYEKEKSPGGSGGSYISSPNYR